MTPQQHMMNGNWPAPRPRANYDQPTMRPTQPWWTEPWVMNAGQNTMQYPDQNMYQQSVQPQPQPNPGYQSSQEIPSGLLGRYVRDISEVVPKEVPMDGRVTYFPIDDGSSVYAKYWDRSGTLREVRYIPEITTNEVAAMEGQTTSFPSVEDIEATISPKLDALSDRLSQIEMALTVALQAGSQAGTPNQPARGNQKPKQKEEC